MESRKGLPKGLDFLGCIDVTLVLRDFQVLTGRIKGILGDDRSYDASYCDKYDDDHKKDDYKKDDDKKDDHKKDDKGCKPKVDVKVEVEEDDTFILIELTRSAAAINLSSVLCNFLTLRQIIPPGTIELVASAATFPIGACVAVNVENIIYAGASAEFCDIPIIIPTGDGVAETTA
ncbi:MAG: hypothetical protein H6Q72_4584 [Firmicutes bacterium]|nr:hypothetical protein [Bacillota bacterium]